MTNDDTRTFPAPAKINLFLHVIGRRDDGYHLLESVFTFIDFADTLHIDVTDDGTITRVHDVPGVREEDDLTLRAARLLQRTTGVIQGAKIILEKKIPLGSGLGGGSSDAATVLLALNRLWGTRLPIQELQKLAIQLGADVPFFVGGQTAFVEGIGEHITPITLPPSWVALALPPVSVSTAEIFRTPQLTRNTPSEKIAAFSKGYGRNDLQDVVVARYPQVGQALTSLQQSAGNARMSGSGAAVFALLDDETSARRTVENLPDGMIGIVTRTMTRHPLLEWSFREE
jgi:4-diphosphocytidyl-2C-methyl-D-erythritol kinase